MSLTYYSNNQNHLPTMRFSTAYSRLLSHELGLEESDWPQLLENTDLTPEHLACDKSFIGLEDQHTIIDNALTLASEPGLGLRFGARLHLVAHGPVGLAASSAPSVAEGIRIMERFQAIRAQFATLTIHPKTNHISLRITPHVDLDSVGLFLMEAMVASFVCSTEFLLGHPPLVERYCFQFPEPEHKAMYYHLLKGECHFRQPYTEIRLPPETLDKRPLYADTSLHQHAVQQCQAIEDALTQPQALADQIRLALRDNHYQHSLETMAEELAICPRTLIRRLKRESTSFRQIREEELQIAALKYLKDPQLTISTIAERLGYQNVVNFRRAFKRWFNTTPADYRDKFF